MFSLAAVFLFTFLTTPEAVKLWDLYPMGTEPDNQAVQLVVDVNSAETVFVKDRQDDGTYLLGGYQADLSPDYRLLNRTIVAAYTRPHHFNTIMASGKYASDRLYHIINDEELDNGVIVKFGLVSKMVGRQRTNKLGRDFTGYIGLGRNAGETDDFKKAFLYHGNIYCAATQCGYFPELGLICEQVTFTTNVSGADAFRNMYEGAVHYTDVKPSTSNGVGWTFDVQGFKFGQLALKRPFKATLSTTSEFLTVPKSVLSHIVKKLKAKWWEEEEVYLVNEKLIFTTDPFIFVVNGKEIRIQPQNFITHLYGETGILKIQQSLADDWTLGEPFTDSVGICLDFDKNLASLHKVPVLSGSPKDAFKKGSLQNIRRLPNGILHKKIINAY